MLAANCGHKEATSLLLDRGAATDQQDVSGGIFNGFELLSIWNGLKCLSRLSLFELNEYCDMGWLSTETNWHKFSHFLTIASRLAAVVRVVGYVDSVGGDSLS